MVRSESICDWRNLTSTNARRTELPHIWWGNRGAPHSSCTDEEKLYRYSRSYPCFAHMLCPNTVEQRKLSMHIVHVQQDAGKSWGFPADVHFPEYGTRFIRVRHRVFLQWLLCLVPSEFPDPKTAEELRWCGITFYEWMTDPSKIRNDAGALGPDNYTDVPLYVDIPDSQCICDVEDCSEYPCRHVADFMAVKLFHEYREITQRFTIDNCARAVVQQCVARSDE